MCSVLFHYCLDTTVRIMNQKIRDSVPLHAMFHNSLVDCHLFCYSITHTNMHTTSMEMYFHLIISPFNFKSRIYILPEKRTQMGWCRRGQLPLASPFARPKTVRAGAWRPHLRGSKTRLI